MVLPPAGVIVPPVAVIPLSPPPPPLRLPNPRLKPALDIIGLI
jgi:hypothetical protein